jgi:zinc transport system permease protein
MNELSLAELWNLFWPSIAAALISAALSGLLGIFVLTRRLAFVSAALGQVSGVGVAGGFLIGSYFGVDPHEHTPLWLDPVLMALLLTAAVAALMSYLPRVTRTTQESVIAFAYLLAASLALVILASPAIVQEAHEVGDLLFGSSVAVRREHLVELVVAAIVVGGSFLLLFKEFVFLSFDREMARASGLPVRRLELWMYLAIGVAVAVGTRAIGALPVFGFLVLPTAAALMVVQSVRAVVALSVAGALLAAVGGFYLSFVESLPTGPMMVLCAAATWPLAWGVRLVQRLRR